MMARSATRSNQRPDTLMQDRSPPARRKPSCDARPNHTYGQYVSKVPGAASTPRAMGSLLNTAYATQLARLFGLRLRYGLRRRERRHRLARRGGSRPWRWHLGPQVLLRSLGKDTGHLFPARLELLGGVRIVAGHLFLAGLELLYFLPQGCEIARHRL